MTSRVSFYIAVCVSVFLVCSLACSSGARNGTGVEQPDGRTSQLTATPLPQDVPPTPTSQPAQPTLTAVAQETIPTPTLAPADPTATATPLPPEPPTLTPVPPTPLPPLPGEEGQAPLSVAQIPELQVFTLDPRSTGLTQLGTFRQRARIDLAAADGSYNGVLYYDAEVNTTAQAVHVVVRAEGSAVAQLPAGQVEAIWVGNQLWIKIANLPWMPVPEQAAEAQFEQQTFSAGAFLPFARSFQRVQPDETVNGIACAHYTYDLQDLAAEYGTVDAQGNVWVALSGGYVVRYLLDANGTFQEPFQGQGTLKLSYDTYDVGADIQINPPRR